MRRMVRFAEQLGFNRCGDPLNTDGSSPRASKSGCSIEPVGGTGFSSRPLRKKPGCVSSRAFCFVPRTGLEPARPCEHQPLKLARLPIPPPGHRLKLSVVGCSLFVAGAIPGFSLRIPPLLEVFLHYKSLFQKVLQRYKNYPETGKHAGNYFCRAESRSCCRKGEANMKSCSVSLSLCSTSSRLPRQAISPW